MKQNKKHGDTSDECMTGELSKNAIARASKQASKQAIIFVSKELSKQRQSTVAMIDYDCHDKASQEKHELCGVCSCIQALLRRIPSAQQQTNRQTTPTRIGV